MKKLFFILMAIFVAIATQAAQKPNFAAIEEGSLEALAEESSINVVVNFRDAVIRGMDEEKYAEVEENWDKERHEIVDDFVEKMNDSMESCGLRASLKSETNVTLTFNVQTIDVRGAIVGKVEFTKVGEEAPFCIVSVQVRGGIAGSHLSLIGDGMDNAGEKIGHLIERRLNRLK